MATAEAAISAWNALADQHGLSRVHRSPTFPRAEKIAARVADVGGLDGWQAALAKIGATPGLLATSDWKIGLDWLLTKRNLTRIMEGRSTAARRPADPDGETKVPGHLVLVPPSGALALNQPDPATVEHRQQVRDVLAGTGFSVIERPAVGDVTTERAEALASQRVAERERSACRQRVLSILIAGGIGVPEIERRGLLDLDEAAARALVEERARHAPAIAAAETAAPANDTVQ